MNRETKLLLEEIVDYNGKIIDKNDGDINKSIDNIITLKYKGHSIWNPFMDETLRIKVDPEEKYSLDKLENFINDYNKK
jgi:hypothetical protein